MGAGVEVGSITTAPYFVWIVWVLNWMACKKCERMGILVLERKEDTMTANTAGCEENQRTDSGVYDSITWRTFRMMRYGFSNREMETQQGVVNR